MPANWIDLSQRFYPGMPGVPSHGDFEHDVDRVNTPDPISLRITHMNLPVHIGTHVDAAAHFMPNGRVIDQYDLSHFVGEGVVLEILREGPTAIGVEDLESATPSVQDGDIVFIHTGYAERFGVEDIHASGHPYITVEAAEWLISKKVRLFGMDVFTPDLPGRFRPDGFDWPVHQVLLGNDTLIIENLGPGIAEAAGHRVEIVAAPTRIKDSDAGLVIPLARIID